VQGFLNDENHARPSRGHHRQITRELNCVPKPFIGVDENGLALDGFLPKPKRLGRRYAADRQIRKLPTNFTTSPTGFEISSQ